MSRDWELRERMKRLAGPVDRRGVWASLEARAAGSESAGQRAGRRRLHAAVYAAVAVVLAAGVAIGTVEAVKHLGQQSQVLVVDDGTMTGTGTGAQPGTDQTQSGGWTRLPLAYAAPPPVYYVAVDPTDSSVLYAATFSGELFKSTDGAKSWTQVLEVAGAQGMMALSIDPACPSTIFVVYPASSGLRQTQVVMRSLDGGDTWADLSAAFQDNSDGMGAPFFDTSTDPSAVYVAGDKYWVSTDQGETWAETDQQTWEEVGYRENYFELTPNAAADIMSVTDAVSGADIWCAGRVVIAPSDTSVYYAPTNQGVYKSMDGGKTWSSASAGLTWSYVEGLAVDPGMPSNLYAATPAGLFKSEDGGATWDCVLADAYPALENGDSAEHSADVFSASVVVAPSSPSTVYAETSTGVFRSDNGGADWKGLAGEGLPLIGEAVFLVAANDPNIVFEVWGIGISRSVDGGDTWTEVLSIPSGQGQLISDPHDPSTLYAYGDGEIHKSVDVGATWTTVASGPWAGSVESLAVDARTPTGLYAVAADIEGTGFSTVFRSTDGGNTWEEVDLAGVPESWITAVLFSPQSPDTMYVQTDYARPKNQNLGPGVETPGSPGVYRSTDGGATWRDIAAGGPADLGVSTIVIDPGPEGGLYAILTDGDLFKWVPEDD